MFESYALANPEALWQHILMLVVSLCIGAAIGYISGKEDLKKLNNKLAKLETDLENCMKRKSPEI